MKHVDAVLKIPGEKFSAWWDFWQAASASGVFLLQDV